jgi:putative transposase
MSSTHLSLHYHLIFSTKNRAPMIAAPWRGRLHGFIGGAVTTLGGVAEIVGGVADHVHLLVGLRATHRLADVLREIKAVSSVWIHNDVGEKTFAWQEGYGAFSVSASMLMTVRSYIEQQEEHHRQRSFQEEYLELLKRSGVKFDERFLW